MRIYNLSPAQPALWLAMLASLASAQDLTTTKPPDFRGYRLYPNGATETLSCDPGNTWFTSSTYAACCSISGRCNLFSACTSGTFTRIFGGTGLCGSLYTGFPSCMSITIYPTYPAGDQTWIQIACGLGDTWPAVSSTIYRETPAATTSSSRSTIPTTPSSLQTSSGGPENTSLSSSSDRVSEKSSSSKAWIAGAVVGPLIGIALIGIAVVWIRRRKMQNANGGNGPAYNSVSQPYASGSPSALGGASHAIPYGHHGAMPSHGDWHNAGIPPRSETVSPLPGYNTHDFKYSSPPNVAEIRVTPGIVSYPAELGVNPVPGPYIAELANNQSTTMAELPGPGSHPETRRN